MDTTSLTRRELHVVFLIALTFPVLFFLSGFYASSLLNGALIDGEIVIANNSSKTKKDASVISLPNAVDKTEIQLDSPPTIIGTQVLATEQTEKHKQSSSITKLTPKKPQAQQHIVSTKPPVVKNSPRYAVQIGLFSNMKSASKWTKSFASKDIEAQIVTRHDAKKGMVYPIIIGTYASEQEAKNAAVEFTNKNKMQTYVTKANSIRSV